MRTDHWFEPIADHLGLGVPAVLVHQGDGAGGRPPRRRARARARAAGARRRLRARAPRPRAGPAGHRGPRHRHQPARSSTWPRATRRRRDVRARSTPGRCAFDAEFDAVDLPVPGRVRPDDGRRRRRGRARRHGPGAATRRAAGAQRVQRLLRRPLPRGRRRSTPTPASPTSAPRSATRPARPRRSTCGPAATRRASCACCSTATASIVERISSVEPGAYGDGPPTTESPEFLVIARLHSDPPGALLPS